MFTGIIQSVAVINQIQDHQGIRTFTIKFDQGFCDALEIGASIAVDGVCLTVTEIQSELLIKFDVMLQSLAITTLSEYQQGTLVNVERAAKEGGEVGGHPLSGHVDFKTAVLLVSKQQDNYCIRFAVSDEWKRYIFPKGYIALNGASLTIATVDKQQGWFEVWLIPETKRMTTFESKLVGVNVNVEIERTTQVLVDTIRESLNESLGELLPLLNEIAAERGFDLDSIGYQNSNLKSD